MTAAAPFEVAACGLVAAAAWLSAGGSDPLRRIAPRSGSSGRVLRGLIGRRGRVVAAAAAAVAVAVLAGPVPGLVTGLVLYVLGRRAKAARRRRAVRATRIADVRVLRAFAAELGSGLPPADALRVTIGTSTSDGLGQRMSAAALAEARGLDPVDVLRENARPSTPAAALAAAWSVCQRTGSSLQAPVQRIADGAAADLRVDREAEAALASARASAQLLAVLPLAGVVLGQVSGAGSLRVLLTTGIGQACLVAGTLLDLAGVAWLDRLADAASA